VTPCNVVKDGNILENNNYYFSNMILNLTAWKIATRRAHQMLILKVRKQVEVPF
jgi:hypothetical protein